LKPKEPYLPPDKIVIIRDTAEAEFYACAFGLLDKIRLASRLSETVIFVMEDKHETHWIVVGLYREFEKPEDNGMGVYCYPKSQFTLEEVQNKLRSYMGSSYIEIKKDAQQ
jgi:hypothetical protein